MMLPQEKIANSTLMFALKKIFSTDNLIIIGLPSSTHILYLKDYL